MPSPSSRPKFGSTAMGTDTIWRVTAWRSFSPAVPISCVGMSSRRAIWRTKYSAPRLRFSIHK